MAVTVKAALPPEVIDLVIDNLYDHPSALRACGLVERNWIGRSRHHLFEAINFWGISPDRANAFAALLRSEHNTIAYHVRRIHLILQNDIKNRNGLVGILPLLPLFSRLSNLDVHGSIQLPLQACRAGQVQSLTLSALTLSGAHMHHHELTALLKGLPALKALVLDRVSPYPPRPFDNREKKFTIELQKLAILLPTPGLLQWLPCSGFAPRARCFKMVLEKPSDTARVTPYFKALGTQLEELAVEFRNTDCLKAFLGPSPRPGPLKHNTSLRHIRIHNAIAIVTETRIGVARHLPILLRQLDAAATAPGLEELALGVVIKGYQEGQIFVPPQEATDLLDFAAGFAARLKRLEVFGPWENLEDILRRQFMSVLLPLLPTQNQRGIVHVVPHRHD